MQFLTSQQIRANKARKEKQLDRAQKDWDRALTTQEEAERLFKNSFSAIVAERVCLPREAWGCVQEVFPSLAGPKWAEVEGCHTEEAKRLIDRSLPEEFGASSRLDPDGDGLILSTWTSGVEVRAGNRGEILLDFKRPSVRAWGELRGLMAQYGVISYWVECDPIRGLQAVREAADREKDWRASLPEEIEAARVMAAIPLAGKEYWAERLVKLEAAQAAPPRLVPFARIIRALIGG